MKTVTKIVMFLMMLTMPVMANDIYVTQSGATLTLDVLQDGQNNTIGNSTTASTVAGATSNFNIDQIGDSNVLTFDINGANYTGVLSTTGNSNNIDFNCDSGGSNSSCATVSASIIWVGSSNDLDIGQTSAATGADVDIVGQTGSDSNVVAATVDGTSVVLTITVNGDSNNYLLDIDGNGDINGHTLVHSHTGALADVDITQSGVNDNIINLTTSGDSHNIDIIQRD